ncbi:O-antigen ligase family protein [Hymenobacter convexus]|uniref:O-antigen ligase family protein n=1 Tax=Hymenobacter sp. CA1UV-4 TaxID=3063782 RepID=UPI00271406EF|nr:O-antigen ligase family protein [Hymenobacter sp. CA1UV-4]MDO7852501.1 O-antigen ligase family protein [Hymenobacter sp. CA1UV-4]
MKLNLRFLYLLPLLAVLFTNPAFNAFFFGKADQAGLGLRYEYALTALALLAAVRYYEYFQPVVRVWLGVLLASMAGLGLESYALWHSWAKYPHVFSKLTALLPLFGMYAVYRRLPPPPYRQLAGLMLVTLLLSLVVVYPEALSLGSFLETERGFSVTSAYLLLPVALLCLNFYICSNNLVYGLACLLCVALIVFLQHRTVWVCTTLALVIDLGLLALRVPRARAWGTRLAVLGALGLGLGLASGLAVVLDNPDVVQKLAKSISDIEHPTTQGTGTFRMQQYEAYLPLVRERPIAGWRLQGFEVPVQFYSDDSGKQVWPDFTGHHFHSLYLDRLFYFGGLGVLLVLLVPVLLLGRCLLSFAPLDEGPAALLAFVATFPVFGLSYDWPNYAYGFIGMLLAITSKPAPAVAERRPARRTLPKTKPVAALESPVFQCADLLAAHPPLVGAAPWRTARWLGFSLRF